MSWHNSWSESLIQWVCLPVPETKHSKTWITVQLFNTHVFTGVLQTQIKDLAIFARHPSTRSCHLLWAWWVLQISKSLQNLISLGQTATKVVQSFQTHLVLLQRPTKHVYCKVHHFVWMWISHSVYNHHSLLWDHTSYHSVGRTSMLSVFSALYLWTYP